MSVLLNHPFQWDFSLYKPSVFIKPPYVFIDMALEVTLTDGNLQWGKME